MAAREVTRSHMSLHWRAAELTPCADGLHNLPMLWFKAFHLIYVARWFAGLFYLPRIFVNLVQVSVGSVA